MMIVGGVEVPSGDISERSRVDLPGTVPQVITLYAPSEEINVPEANGEWRNHLEVQGVSYGRNCCPVLRPCIAVSSNIC